MYFMIASGILDSRRNGDVAQLGERCNRTAEVVGSIPIISTPNFSWRAMRNFARQARESEGGAELLRICFLGRTV